MIGALIAVLILMLLFAGAFAIGGAIVAVGIVVVGLALAGAGMVWLLATRRGREIPDRRDELLDTDEPRAS